MFKLGFYFQTGGKDEQALAVYLKALELSKQAGKWAHPEIPPVIYVGVIEFRRQEKYEEAAQLLEQMVAIYEAWHEPTQAIGYRQNLEEVRKLIKPGPTEMINAKDFPKGTFAATIGIDHWRIDFDAEGRFAIFFGDNKVVEGTFKVVHDKLELTDETGPGAEKGDRKSGTYRWRFSNRKLTLTKIKDEADPRGDPDERSMADQGITPTDHRPLGVPYRRRQKAESGQALGSVRWIEFSLNRCGLP